MIAYDELLSTLNNAPIWWDQDEGSKHNAIFVMPLVSVDKAFEEVKENMPEVEKAGYFGRVVFWSAPLKTFSRTRWSRVVSSFVYDSITIRNASIVKKILQLAKE